MRGLLPVSTEPRASRALEGAREARRSSHSYGLGPTIREIARRRRKEAGAYDPPRENTPSLRRARAARKMDSAPSFRRMRRGTSPANTRADATNARIRGAPNGGIRLTLTKLVSDLVPASAHARDDVYERQAEPLSDLDVLPADGPAHELLGAIGGEHWAYGHQPRARHNSSRSNPCPDGSDPRYRHASKLIKSQLWHEKRTSSHSPAQCTRSVPSQAAVHSNTSATGSAGGD
jgi:hypothetical protein